MDYLKKSLSSSYKSLVPYSQPFSDKTYSNNNETFNKNYSESDTFQISNKLISPEEWDAIHKLLISTKSSNFHTISLSGTNIESYGLKKLSDIILLNKNIKTLILEWNYLNEYHEELDILCSSISKSNSIVYLHLNNNKLSSQQVDSISKVIRNNNLLLQLDLRWNEIGNEGAKGINDILSTNTVIQEINLIGNKVSQENIFEINARLDQNKNLYYNFNLKKENNKISKFSEITKGFMENSKTNRSELYSPYLKYFRENSEKSPVNIENTENNELAVEYKARYDSQLLNNANLEKKVKELEILLNNEKCNADEFKSQITKELLIEKDKIVIYEDEILKQKEEFLRRELELRKLIQEKDLEVSEHVQLKKDHLIEINLLKEEIIRQKEIYQDKFLSLEEQFDKNKQFFDINYIKLKEENDKMKTEFEDIIKNINLDWDRKYKLIEEQGKILKILKDDIEKENFNLRKEINDGKLSREVEFKDRESRIIEEENRKLENIIKNFESKFRLFESYKEELNQKNSKLIEEINILRKNLTEEYTKYERNENQFLIEKNNLQKYNNRLTQSINKLNSEISNKDALINKLKSDLNEINSSIKSCSSKNSSTIQDLTNDYVKDKQLWEKERQEFGNKILDIETNNNELKYKLEKKELENLNMLENLKSKVSKFIDDKYKEKYKI